MPPKSKENNFLNGIKSKKHLVEICLILKIGTTVGKQHIPFNKDNLEERDQVELRNLISRHYFTPQKKLYIDQIDLKNGKLKVSLYDEEEGGKVQRVLFDSSGEVKPPETPKPPQTPPITMSELIKEPRSKSSMKKRQKSPSHEEVDPTAVKLDVGETPSHAGSEGTFGGDIAVKKHRKKLTLAEKRERKEKKEAVVKEKNEEEAKIETKKRRVEKIKTKDTVIRTGKGVEEVKQALLDEVFGVTKNPQARDQLESLLKETKGKGGEKHNVITKTEASAPSKKEHEDKVKKVLENWHKKKISAEYKQEHIKKVLKKNPVEARKKHFQSSYYKK